MKQNYAPLPLSVVHFIITSGVYQAFHHAYQMINHRREKERMILDSNNYKMDRHQTSRILVCKASICVSGYVMPQSQLTWHLTHVFNLKSRKGAKWGLADRPPGPMIVHFPQV